MTASLRAPWEKLSPRDRKALCLGLFFCALAAAYFALADPILEGFDQVESQRHDIERQLSRDRNAARLLWQREAKLAELSAQYELYTRSLNIMDNGYLDQARFMEDIEDNARLMGVAIEQLRPLGKLEPGGHFESPVEIAFRGSLSDVQKFVYFLETSNEVFIVSDLALTAREGGGDFQGKISLTKMTLGRDSASAESRGPARVLTLGLYKRVANGPLYIAEAKGWLATGEGRVSLLDLDHYKSVEMLLGSGDLRAINTSFLSLSYLREIGLDFRAVFITDFSSNRMGLVVSKGSSIKSVADLPGKTVFMQAAQFSHFGFSTLLAKYGVPHTALKVINMAPGMVLRSMEAGLIEAAFVEEPYLDMLTRSGSKVVESYRPEGDGLPRVIAVGRELTSGPGMAEVSLLIDAYQKGLAWWRANKAEGNRIVAERLKLSREQFDRSMEFVSFPTQEKLADFVCGQGAESMAEYARLMEVFYGKYRNRETKIPLSEIVDTRLLRSAAGCKD
jgi:ABC-type nitrate/sulfonate/bicarbonate transport system substrate-binding protein